MMPANTERLKLLQRKKVILQAREDLIVFAQFMMPVPDDRDDVTISLYRPAKHHRVLGAALEQVEKGIYKRLQISLPPRHGKTKLASHMFAAWFIGRNPGKSIIVATYSEKFAWDHGRAVRALIESPLYRQVFPNVSLIEGAASVDRLETEQGGVLFFLGRGSGATGRGADVILLDDPTKDRKEADSTTIREQLWSWYTQVLQTRLMTKAGAITIIQTRWHEDDLIGRLTDPTNACYSLGEAKKWHVIDMPAIARKGDILGRQEGEALWPERFDRDYLDSLRETDVRGFQALYQGRPTPEEGSFFKAVNLRTYARMDIMPPRENMRFYCASDHAVSLEQGRDKTCLMAVGIDDHDQMWVQPDLFWRQADTNLVVEAMLVMMERYKPLFWWAGKDHISKSIGPFLRKRMLEKRVFCSIEEITPVGDKQTRAQSIQARTSMMRVVFPGFARWWPEAYDQLLKFPQASHDDFVDTLALLGTGLHKQRGLRKMAPKKEAPKLMTYGWVIESAAKERKRERENRATGGW
jgi:predicted phage terminase large subunit-like protein